MANDKDKKETDIKTADGAYYHGAKRAIVTATFTTVIGAALVGVIAYFTKGRSVKNEISAAIAADEPTTGVAGMAEGLAAKVQGAIGGNIATFAQYVVGFIGAGIGAVGGFLTGGVGGFVSGWRHSNRMGHNLQVKSQENKKHTEAVAALSTKVEALAGQEKLHGETLIQTVAGEGQKTREAIGQFTGALTSAKSEPAVVPAAAEETKTREPVGDFTGALQAAKGEPATEAAKGV